jgi:hypothetical protein
LFSTILREFRAARITKAELARRVRKAPAQITRMLSSPKNMTSDTAALLLLGMKGGELSYSVTYPLDLPPRNYSGEAVVFKNKSPLPTKRTPSQTLSAPIKELAA